MQVSKPIDVQPPIHTHMDTHIRMIKSRERRLFILLILCFLLACLGRYLLPLTPDVVARLLAKMGLHPHLGGHDFVDQRAWLGIPNAANVLSNIPYAVFGGYGVL